MGLKCGIIGLPNVGKSTLFNALTNSKVAQVGNYPFCTIDANKGQTMVPDTRLQKISDIFKPQKLTPTSFEFTDIAGLVKGASLGEGLGNQFLSHIRECDSLLHVVRFFEDEEIQHTQGSTDPLRDIEIINLELQLADLESVEKILGKKEKKVRVLKDKEGLLEVEALKKALETLKEGKNLREKDWSEKETEILKSLNFITLKPILYICNFKEEDFSQNLLENELVKKVKEFLGEKEELICLSCALESDMIGLSDEEKKEFLESLNLKEPALHTVIKKVYSKLGLISFFTAGEKEVRAWTTSKEAFAPQAAGVIHTDFEKGFIRAEVYHCKELFEHGSEKSLKEKGLVKTVGKDHKVQDGEVMHFLFNV